MAVAQRFEQPLSEIRALTLFEFNTLVETIVEEEDKRQRESRAGARGMTPVMD